MASRYGAVCPKSLDLFYIIVTYHIKWVKTSCTYSPFFVYSLVSFFLIKLCRQSPRPPQVGQDFLDIQYYFYVSVYYIRGQYYVIYTSPYLHSFFSISFIQGLYYCTMQVDPVHKHFTGFTFVHQIALKFSSPACINKDITLFYYYDIVIIHCIYFFSFLNFSEYGKYF